MTINENTKLIKINPIRQVLFEKYSVSYLIESIFVEKIDNCYVFDKYETTLENEKKLSYSLWYKKETNEVIVEIDYKSYYLGHKFFIIKTPEIERIHCLNHKKYGYENLNIVLKKCVEKYITNIKFEFATFDKMPEDVRKFM